MVALGGPVAAFQEETVVPVAPADGSDATAAQIVGGEAPDLAEAEPSTDVTLPGLGTIGSLPKLDFGLELLYGANSDDPVGASDPALGVGEDGELTIKGRARYNF